MLSRLEVSLRSLSTFRPSFLKKSSERTDFIQADLSQVAVAGLQRFADAEKGAIEARKVTPLARPGAMAVYREQRKENEPMSDTNIQHGATAHAAHPAPTVHAPFSEAEWQEFHKSDIGAGGAIVVLMAAIFGVGLVMYAVIAIVVAG
jgi:hypothetical protein